MKRLFAVGVVALLGAVSQVSAADLGRRPMAAPAPMYAPVFSWAGLYLGVNGGYGWGNSSWTGLSNNFDTSGGLFGGTIGYNWQFGQTVVGLEGDLQWSDIKGSGASVLGPVTTTNNWFGTVRGRLGYAWDQFMPYVTGGLAYGNIEATPSFGFITTDKTNAGWTLGAGVEFAFAPQWSAKVEYLYVDLGDVSYSPLPAFPTTVDFTANIVRGGINYRF